jgi:hypothetical protein
MDITYLVSVTSQVTWRQLSDEVQGIELARQDILRDRHSRVDDGYT